MVAVLGDAEIDEGNVFEALLEGWKHDLRNTWWIIDYNRQSLDSIVSDRLFYRIERMFRMTGWNVITLKYGKKMLQAFALPGGKALKRWIDDCPNSLYSALTFQGGPAWRKRLAGDLAGEADVPALLARYDDAALSDVMTNLAGHDMETVLEAFDSVDERRAHVFHRVHHQGLRPAPGGPQGQPRGPAQPRPDGGIPGPDERAQGRRMGRLRRPRDGARTPPGLPRLGAVQRRA